MSLKIVTPHECECPGSCARMRACVRVYINVCVCVCVSQCVESNRASVAHRSCAILLFHLAFAASWTLLDTAASACVAPTRLLRSRLPPQAVRAAAVGRTTLAMSGRTKPGKCVIRLCEQELGTARGARARASVGVCACKCNVVGPLECCSPLPVS